jgi:phosphonate transport system substrate-binding protein
MVGGATPGLTPEALTLTSCQAPNADPSVAAVAAYLAGQLGLSVTVVDQLDWQERERLLDRGQIEIGWICGWPYVRKMRRTPPNLELLAAPVPAGARYGGQPIYFSDVVVRSDSPYHAFAELRGAVWGYNEPGSQSGYNVVRYHLARRGLTREFFGRLVATGAHENSLRELLAGHLQASAIDSTVLETEFKRQPALREQVRIIEVMGPSPSPPWVVQTHLPLELRATLRRLLLEMHDTPDGQAALATGNLARFARVSDADYDVIREMERAAAHIDLRAEDD